MRGELLLGLALTVHAADAYDSLDTAIASAIAEMSFEEQLKQTEATALPQTGLTSTPPTTTTAATASHWDRGRTLPSYAPYAYDGPRRTIAPRPATRSAVCSVARSEILFVDADFQGHDITEVGDFPQLMGGLLALGKTEGDLIERCCKLCAAEPRCKAWSFRQSNQNGASCSLKHQPVKHIVPTRRPFSGTMSGFTMSPAECVCANRGVGEHCWSVQPLGCYRDELNRAVGIAAGLAHSARHCAQLCVERLPSIWSNGVIALGSGGMCFCSTEQHDYARYGRVVPGDDATNSCTMKCRGSAEMCGNTLAISVYRTELSEAAECAVERPSGVGARAAPRASARGAEITALAAPTATYLGCYKDNSVRTMLWEGILTFDPYPCACSCKLRYGKAFTGVVGLQGGRCYCEGEAGGRGRLAKDKYDQLGKEDEVKCESIKIGREKSIDEVRVGGQWTNAVYRVVLGEAECDAMSCKAKSQQTATTAAAVVWDDWEDCAPMPGYDCVVPFGSKIRIGARRPTTGDIVVDAESPTMTCSRGKMMDLILPRLLGHLPSVRHIYNFMCERSDWARIRLASCWYQDIAKVAAKRARSRLLPPLKAPSHTSAVCAEQSRASTPALEECLRTGDWSHFVANLVGPGFGETIVAEMKMCRNVKQLARCLPPMQPYYLPPNTPQGSVPSTAIIVPFRGRPNELHKFIYWLIPTLLRQNIMFKIYVIEELAFKMWNKAQMLNIGVIEAMKDHEWGCFVFHDIDIVLEANADTCRYVCEDTNIVHYSTWLRGYKRAYSEGLVDLTPVHGGGIAAASYEQLVKVNGWSNMFWGWGSEDNEFGGRTKTVFKSFPVEWGNVKLHGKRCPFIHMHDEEEGVAGSHSNVGNNDALALRSPGHLATDGMLSNTHYKIIRVADYALYTKITVEMAA